jgi:hypothetical protein
MYEFIKIKKEDAVREFEKSGLKLHLPAIGDSFSI